MGISVVFRFSVNYSRFGVFHYEMLFSILINGKKHANLYNNSSEHVPRHCPSPNTIENTTRKPHSNYLLYSFLKMVLNHFNPIHQNSLNSIVVNRITKVILLLENYIGNRKLLIKVPENKFHPK